MACIPPAYEVPGGARLHRRARLDVLVVAVLTCAAAWWHQAAGAAVLAVGALVWCLGRGRRARGVAVVCVVAVLVATWRSDAAWEGVQPRHAGRYTGWVELVGDPAPFGAGLRVTLEIDGERFDAWAYGSPRRRLIERQSGDIVWIAGSRRPLGANARRAQIRHVVGRFELDYIGDVATPAPLDRASGRVRDALRRAAEASMPADEAALFTGLVIGDDSREPPAMVEAFRGAGLSHLTAVSGQNVAFLLAAAGLLLRRLRPWWRWGVSVGLIAWFMALTRFEPSVLRAGLMAMLAISAFTLGRRQHPARLLALALTVLVLVDPFLVWSVGLWLSVGATAGVCVVGPWLTERLRGPPWWTLALGTTLGAQVGVVVPSMLVFHRLPVGVDPGQPARRARRRGGDARRSPRRVAGRVGPTGPRRHRDGAVSSGHALGGHDRRCRRPAGAARPVDPGRLGRSAGRRRRPAAPRTRHGRRPPAGAGGRGHDRVRPSLSRGWSPGSRRRERSRTHPTPAWSSRSGRRGPGR